MQCLILRFHLLIMLIFASGIDAENESYIGDSAGKCFRFYLTIFI